MARATTVAPAAWLASWSNWLRVLPVFVGEMLWPDLASQTSLISDFTGIVPVRFGGYAPSALEEVLAHYEGGGGAVYVHCWGGRGRVRGPPAF